VAAVQVSRLQILSEGANAILEALYNKISHTRCPLTLLQSLTPKAPPSQTCNIDMGIFLSGYGSVDVYGSGFGHMLQQACHIQTEALIELHGNHGV
jgi:hypothetical protein